MMHGDEVERAVVAVNVRDVLGHLALMLRRVGHDGRGDLV